MTPEEAQQEAYAYAYCAFDEYIHQLMNPTSPESQCLQENVAPNAEDADYDPTAPQQILRACQRLAHQLYRQSNLAGMDIQRPEYPDPAAAEPADPQT